MSQRRKIFIVILVIFLVGGIVVGFFAIKNSSSRKTYTVDTPKEAERGGALSVAISNTASLSDLLLYQQFVAARDQTSAYILSKYGNSIKTATVSGEPVLNDDGTIQYTVTLEGDKASFQVVIDKLTYFDKIIFSVPADNYQVTIPVYGGSSTGD